VHLPRLTAVVHESDRGTVRSECKKAVVELYSTDPRVIRTTPALSAPPLSERLASLIDPKKVVYGGKSDAPARYLDPTILYPISWSDKIMEDEIFGAAFAYPHLFRPLARYSRKSSRSRNRLLAMCSVEISKAIDRVLQSLSFGGGAVNQTNVFLFIESMPYGGVGSSGIGNYYGKYGYDSLTHAKSNPDISTGGGDRPLVSTLHNEKFQHLANGSTIRVRE